MSGEVRVVKVWSSFGWDGERVVMVWDTGIPGESEDPA